MRVEDIYRTAYEAALTRSRDAPDPEAVAKAIANATMDRLYRESAAKLAVVDDDVDDWGLGPVAKAADEKRYTFGVVYKASSGWDDPQLDAHGEFSTEDELQNAQWGYVRGGDRNIYVQHGLIPALGMKKIGEWVDIARIPWDITADFTLPGSDRVTKAKRTIPANSVWMGVVWEPDAWAAIKAGEIRGFSFGGKARRLTVDKE